MAWTDDLARTDKAARKILGSDVLYTPGVGSAVTVRGVFDERHRLPGGPSEIDVDRGWGPAVFLTLADLPTDPETDTATITIGGVAYTVHETHKDGLGGVLCLLNKVGA